MTKPSKKKTTKHQPRKGRFTARRKSEAVRRLVGGEDLDELSRELGVTASTLAEWRETFLQAGESALKTRARDSRDDENFKLKAMLGDLTMRYELQVEKARLLEEFKSRPFSPKRPRP